MKKSIYLVFVVQFFFLVSCNANANKGNKTSAIDAVENKEIKQCDTIVKVSKPDTVITLSKGVEKVEMWCAFFGYGMGEGFYLYISDSEIKYVDDDYTKKYYFINDIDTKNKIIDYTNSFYIEETEKMYFKRTRLLDGIVGDYPIIRVKAFIKGKKIFEKRITIGINNREEKGDTIILEDEGYRYEYNPKFMKFYELLESLIP